MKEIHAYPLPSGLMRYGFLWTAGEDAGNLVWNNGHPLEVHTRSANAIMKGDWDSVETYYHKWKDKIVLVEIAEEQYEFTIAGSPGFLVVLDEKEQ